MKKHIISVLCLILGLVIGAGGYLIYDLATSAPDKNVGSEIVAPAAGASNHELVEKVKRRMRERGTWQGRLYGV